MVLLNPGPPEPQRQMTETLSLYSPAPSSALLAPPTLPRQRYTLSTSRLDRSERRLIKTTKPDGQSVLAYLTVEPFAVVFWALGIEEG